MELSRQEYWSGLPFPPPHDLLDPGIEPGSATFQADSLLSEPSGKSLKGNANGEKKMSSNGLIVGGLGLSILSPSHLKTFC